MRLPGSVSVWLIWLGICGLLLGLMQCSILADSGHLDAATPVITPDPVETSTIPASIAQEPAAVQNSDSTPDVHGSNTDAVVHIADSAEIVEHSIETPPFQEHDIDLPSSDDQLQHETADVASARDKLPTANEALMLLDAVSTNSGINSYPEIAVAKTLVSLVDSPAHIRLDQPPADSSADKSSNHTAKPHLAAENASADNRPDRTVNVSSDEATIEPAENPLKAPATAQIDPINDSGGGGGTSVPPHLPNVNDDIVGSSSSSSISDPTTDPAPVVEETQIPLFSEWAQKRMEEVEKEQEQDAANTSTQKRNHTAGTKVGTAALKLRTKNYASPDCGAKIVASNAESSNTRAVLTLTKDEYLLSPCTSRIWFVVELCEAIQAEMIDLANFELFSSSPKNFSVAVANRFPTRDWSQVGRFTAQDERDIQSFDLHPHLFGKYVRVDIHSHYNSEHFCPISLFRVYGTSEFEAFETENRLAADDDDDDDDDAGELEHNSDDRNIFKSASDAVMSIVKAAATFVKPQENRTGALHDAGQGAPLVGGVRLWCISPVHLVQCHECSENFTAAVAQLVACKQSMLRRMLAAEFLYQALMRSRICAGLVGLNGSGNHCGGQHSGDNSTLLSQPPTSEWITWMLPVRYVAALCNILASDELLSRTANASVTYRATATTNVTIDRKDNSIAVPDKVEPSFKVVDNPRVIYVQPTVDSGAQKTDPLPDAVQPQPDVAIVVDEVLPQTQIQSPLIDQPETMGSGEAAVDSKEDSYVFEGDLHDNDSAEPVLTTITDAAEAIALPLETLAEMPVNSIVEMASELLNAGGDAAVIATTTPMPLVDEAVVGDDGMAAVNAGGVSLSGGQKVQSESVFLRLSNRVKSLERNMSLSGQYLEELSRRYKKQVEELQLAFAKTLQIVEEQSKRTLEREQQLFEQNERLRGDVDQLHERLGSWHQHFAIAATMLTVQFVWWLLRRLCSRSTAEDDAVAAEEIPDNLSLDNQSRSMRLRRKSTDGTGGTLATGQPNGPNGQQPHVAAKRRRPSEEAMHIAGRTYANLMIEEVSADAEEYDHFVDPTNGVDNYALTARQQRKQRRHVKRTMSLDQTSVAAHGRRNDHQLAAARRPRGSCDNLTHSSTNSDAESTAGSEPVLDENYEVYVPGSDMAYNEFMPDGPSGQSTPMLDTSTGTSTTTSTAQASSTSLTSKKSDKFRRLSSPAFLKSPFSRASSLSLGGKAKSGHEQTTGWEWYRRKDAAAAAASSQVTTTKPTKVKKAKSESPSDGSTAVANGAAVTESASATQLSSRSLSDKKQGSFRRMLKKVF